MRSDLIYPPIFWISAISEIFIGRIQINSHILSPLPVNAIVINLSISNYDGIYQRSEKSKIGCALRNMNDPKTINFQKCLALINTLPYNEYGIQNTIFLKGVVIMEKSVSV